MSFFSHIQDILHKIVNAVAHIFSSENIAKAAEIAKPISDLIVFCAPFVEMVAKATSGTLDDRLVAAAESLNLTVNGILAEPDEAIRKGQILTLVGTAALDSIKALLTTDGHGISIGDFHVDTPEDVHKIPGDLVDAAVQLSYSLFVKARA